VLHHAVPRSQLENATTNGLRPTGRRHVHLSFRREHARNAIKPEDRPVLLRVATGSMVEAGVAFFVSPKGTWLVEFVPPGALEIVAE